MLLLFSKGRSLPARTQPPSPSPSICSWSVFPCPCLLDQILNEPFILFDTSSSFAATCGNLDKDGFYYFKYKKCIRKLLWLTVLCFEMKLLLSQTRTEFSTVAFSCLPVFFHTFLHLLFLSSPPPLPYFPSFYKSLPVRSHSSPAPDCAGRKIKCCQSCAREN